MKKSFQFRIYPTKKQEVILNRTLSACRHLYNDALSERKRNAELNRLKQQFDVFPWGKPEWMNYYDQANGLSKSKTSHQKSVQSHVLQNVLKRVDRSFQNFFNGYGYPRFQGQNRYNSFTYPDSESGYKLKDRKLILSKIGSIKTIQHREIEGKIKTCTIKRDVDQWYVSFSCDVDKLVTVEIKTEIGIDVGLKSLLTFSNGKQIYPPKFLRASENKLIHEQKKLSRKRKGSNNRNKQRIKVAKTHRKIKNQRKDFNQKLSTEIVNTYDKIVFENLQIQNMVKNHHLAKSISDAGWYQLMNLTEYKAAYAGKLVEFVDPRNTSQTCPICNHIQIKKLTLKDRVFKCEVCEYTENRDIVGAKNILNKSSTAGIAGINALQGFSIEEQCRGKLTTFRSE